MRDKFGRIMKGKRLSPETEFKKGQKATGRPIKKRQRLSPATEFKPGQLPHNYKGERGGYSALHSWVKRNKGKASAYPCEHCGAQARCWANKSHEYLPELDDFIPLCDSCHARYDNRGEKVRAAMMRKTARERSEHVRRGWETRRCRAS